MILQAILNLLHTLAVSLFTALHNGLPGAPSIWNDALSSVNSLIAIIPASVRYFVPIHPLVLGLVALVGVETALGALRLGRRVLSLFTGGGGAA